MRRFAAGRHGQAGPSEQSTGGQAPFQPPPTVPSPQKDPLSASSEMEPLWPQTPGTLGWCASWKSGNWNDSRPQFNSFWTFASCGFSMLAPERETLLLWRCRGAPGMSAAALSWRSSPLCGKTCFRQLPWRCCPHYWLCSVSSSAQWG